MTDREAFMAVLFNGPLAPTDAICVFSGDGITRLQACVGALRQGIAHWVLLSGGVDDPPHSLTSADMTTRMVEYGLAPKRIVEDPDSRNTHDQAEWLAGFMQERDLESVTLVASPYHMPRAYLTVLQSLKNRDMTEDVLVLPLPAGQTEWWGCPDGLDVTRMDLFPGELAKIDEYGAKGHVASYADGLEYLRFWESSQADTGTI